METVSSLFAVKAWLEGLIQQENVRLKAPQQNDKTDAYTLVFPAVHVGYVPPKTILNDSTEIRIPCLVVGTSEADSDDESNSLDLRITAAIWDPGTQAIRESSQKLQLAQNFDGYITLLNLLDRVKRWIRREDSVAGHFRPESQVKLTTNEEQPWPYWYGAVEVTVSEEPDPMTRYSGVLN